MTKGMAEKKNYSVKQLADLAGVSVRTLHLYDEIGLLKPATRTEAGYRLYGETELLRLQQILFYKLLDFPLQEIGYILDDPDFNLVKALMDHKTVLKSKQDSIAVLLKTIDKTISQLNEKVMLNHEELYEGLPKEEAEAYREGAINEYGKEEVERSEKYLRSLSKEAFTKLKADSAAIAANLAAMMNEDPTGGKVQNEIAHHYQNIRQFWGTANFKDKQADAYRGLGELYVNDERFAKVEGKSNIQFALFLNKAMAHFADTKLK
jgi:DNA-binding transcriptional MerR regulator